MTSWENKFVRILESDDWIVDYDKEKNKYRVSYFEDFHFVDEIWFDAYENKEVDKIELEKDHSIFPKVPEPEVVTEHWFEGLMKNKTKKEIQRFSEEVLANRNNNCYKYGQLIEFFEQTP